MVGRVKGHVNGLKDFLYSLVSKCREDNDFDATPWFENKKLRFLCEKACGN